MVTLREPGGARAAQPGVLFFINDLAIGGAERVLVSLVNNLRRFRPTVVLLRPVADLLGELNPEIGVYSLSAGGGPGPDGRGRRGLLVLEAPRLLINAIQLRRLARLTNCAIVSTFLNRSHTVALTSKLMAGERLRVIVNVHEVLTDHLAIHFAPFERRLMSRFIRGVFPRADAICAVADGAAADLSRNFGVARPRIRLVRNPLDLTRIRESAAAALDDADAAPGFILGVGRLVRLKGFDLLIRALARLPETLAPRLVLIGDGPEHSSLARLAADVGVSHRVRFAGPLKNPWNYMARARVVVVPSRTEAFPNVIGEALALSVPVVAAECSGGVVEYLENGACGLLVPPDDADALARALERALMDDDLRRTMTAAGLRRVTEFALPDAVRRYEDLLEAVHGAAGPAVPEDSTVPETLAGV